VHDALRVRGSHGVSDLDGIPQRFTKAQPVFRYGSIEGDAFDELHDEVVRTDVMDRANARMIEGRNAARFACEAVTELAGGELERDHPVEPRIARRPDFTHPAGADALDELIRPDQLARRHRPDRSAIHAAAMVAKNLTGHERRRKAWRHPSADGPPVGVTSSGLITTRGSFAIPS
jgi:hypothetical protein